MHAKDDLNLHVLHKFKGTFSFDIAKMVCVYVYYTK